MIDKSYVFQEGFIFGMIVGVFITGAAFYPNFGDKYKNLLRQTKYLISSQKGIISVSDLAFDAEISPAKAAKFLNKLARQLEIQPEVSESGGIYYKFDSGKEISQQHFLKKDS